MGPACAVVDAQAGLRYRLDRHRRSRISRATGSPRILGLKPAQVRAIWVRGAGSYGRNDAGDAAMDAAVMSQAVGAPVRVQYMRAEGTGWDPKGPASMHRARAGLDADGKVVGYHFDSRGFSRTDIDTTESDPAHSLAGQLMGMALTPTQEFGIPTEPYVFPAQLRAWETIAAAVRPRLAAAQLASARSRRAAARFRLENPSSTNWRTPPAAMPVAFRLAHLQDARAIAAISACAASFRLAGRASPAAAASPTAVVTAAAFAYAQRGRHHRGARGRGRGQPRQRPCPAAPLDGRA